MINHIGRFSFHYDNPRMSTRVMKDYFKRSLIVGAEVGVREGDNARTYFKHLNVKKLYLIDTDFSPFKKSKFNQDKIVIINKSSDEASKFIPDDLDFVYIDGDHSHEQVKKDIANYWKKIRKGGVLAGHDIDQVCQAVFEFFKDKDVKLNIAHLDWWVIRN